jgi:putative spermidine/putrescine transport system substrate-binding protein
MLQKKKIVLSVMLIATLLLAGVTVAQENVSIDDTDLAGMSWDELVAAADGGTVNWFMWGGSDIINAYVSDWVGSEMMDQYNITLNRVGITDTVDAVNQVLGEAEAGQDDNGSVDMIWINGENFRTMKQGGLLFCDYLDVMPNVEFLNRDDPTVAFDFGTAVEDCEVGWGRAQVAMIYNSDFVEEPPTDIDSLLEWACENPGSFTYPAPPDFTGSVFVRHVFYNEANKLFPDDGGYEVLLGEFDEDTYNQVAEATWATLNEIEPCLWSEGQTYPRDKAALDQLFANTEIVFNVTYEPSSAGVLIENGTFPPATLSYVLESGTIGNVHYVAIPYNSPNKAAAIVLANFLISPAAQLEKNKPDVWGVTSVLDPMGLPEDFMTQFAELPRHPAVVSQEELAAVALPELQGEWLTQIEQGWQENVAEQ